MADDTQNNQNTTNGHVNPIHVQKFLKGANYPMTKEELIKKAKDEGADENVIKTLQNMKMDKFNSPNDVAQTIGQIE